MGFFDGASTQNNAIEKQQVESLSKALFAGYGTDSATFVNGRAMIPENLEATTINVIAAMKDDCKVLNSLKTVNVKSTVHEKNRRTSHGDWRFLTVPEGGASVMTDQELERVIYLQKFIQTKRAITLQMEKVDTFEPAYATEKIAGVEVVCKATEHNIFHGDSSIIPTEFDGFLASIRKSKDPTIIDLRGDTIGSRGESLFDEVAREVWERGGDLQKTLFPSILARDIKDLFTDRIRYEVGTKNFSFTEALPPYFTAIGSNIKFTGDAAGPDKFYRVKGLVEAAGDAIERPLAPTSVALTPKASAAGSKFLAADAGDYKYVVHSVNAKGISEGKNAAAAATVAAGGSVSITITPDKSRPVTGLIICRSKVDGDDVMEMVQIPCGPDATTVHVDLNKDLPGTASMLFLTETKIRPVYELGQLLPVSTYPLYPTDRAETPFLVIFFSALEVNAPEFCAIVDNIKYQGGF
ncbi:MAG: hypothetical protein LBF78_06885 [Treponema sp.]|jgi:hypothetical protein|nr:hypothetical protein [Treponema sp.]